jgi:hypothetical protein
VVQVITNQQYDLLSYDAPLPEKIAFGKKTKMTQGSAALFVLVQRYFQALLDPTICLLEIHKLMYFLQESGVELRLSYKKDYYGPYSENLSHMLNAAEGHLLLGYTDGGDDPSKEIRIISGAEAEVKEFLGNNSTTIRRIERVSRLIDGFETSFGLELLATVHWVANDQADSNQGIIERVYSLGTQKRKFTERQIVIAIARLKSHGWLNEALT